MSSLSRFRKKILPLMVRTAVPAIALMFAAETFAQTGVVAGRVEDRAGSALPGAQITIQELNIRGVTNTQGEFTLGSLPAGTYTVVIDYLGYESTRQSITVADGQRANISLALRQAGIAEEIIVRASPIVDSQARALNQQRMADNVSNVISSDAIGRFPDSNIAEALQRAPGVGIQRDQGEGRYINVRGAPAEFSAVAINGISMPAPDPFTRAVDLDTIPSDIVSQIEVSKTLRPDQDADSIAGAVNIVTRSPFDSRGPQLRGSAGMSDNEYGKNDSRGSLQASNLFGSEQQFGALVSLSYSKTRRQVDNVENVWTVVNRPEGGERLSLIETLFKDYDTRRERVAATTSLEWRPTDTDSYYMRGSWARFTDDEFRNRTDILWEEGTLQPGSTDLSGTYNSVRLQKQFRHRVQQNDITSLAVGGDHELSNYAIDYSLSVSRAKQSYPNRDELLLRSSLRPNVSYDFSQDSNNPSYSVFNTGDLQRVDRMAFRENTFRWNTGVEDEVSVQTNIEMPGMLFSQPTTFKYGVKFRGREKDHDEERYRDRRAGSAPTQPLLTFLSSEPSANYGYDLGFKMDPVVVKAYLDGARANSLSQRRIPQSITADYSVEEDIYAAYGSARVEYDNAELLLGLRMERTQQDSSSPSFNEVTGAIGERTAGTSYTEFFPGATLRYSFSENLIGRAAITRSISRPNFLQTVPRLVENDASAVLRVSAGNPDLKPTLTNNLDLMLEYYVEPLGLISGGLFYKDLSDYRYELTLNGNFEGQAALITRPENAPDGRILGAEVNWQQQLTMLPGFWSNFGVFANYTYTDAHMKLGRTYNGRSRFALPGQSDHTYNLSAFYEADGLSVRLSYTDRSDYLDAIDADDGRLDLFWEGRSQLDLTASYAVTDNFEVFFEGKNLSDTSGARYYGSRERTYEYEKFGSLYFLGARFNF
ncbi:MAG: TonB-dependent receptor [Pseudohongiella sp.]|nr:TonB-dependent receptor [Pseudohongiella sp.]